MTDIGNCDLLIAETSDKGIGFGIEVGYAKAKGKMHGLVKRRQPPLVYTFSGLVPEF